MSIRRIVRAALVLIVVALAAWLAYGPLFAWLPVTPGFIVARQDRLEILYRRGTRFTAAHQRFGAAARAVESAVGLSFNARTRIVLCDAWSDVRRFTPWLPASRSLGARTLPIGHVVYVTPLVRDREDADTFVRHELVHVLLHQHMPLRQRLDGGRPAWLIEGLATLVGNPSAYPSGDALMRQARGVDVRRLLIDGPSAGGATLFYAESRDFVGSLDSRFGRERLRAFVADYVRDPSQWPAAFARAFGVPYESALSAFLAARAATPESRG